MCKPGHLFQNQLQTAVGDIMYDLKNKSTLQFRLLFDLVSLMELEVLSNFLLTSYISFSSSSLKCVGTFANRN